jgi:hypothetical protein
MFRSWPNHGMQLASMEGMTFAAPKKPRTSGPRLSPEIAEELAILAALQHLFQPPLSTQMNKNPQAGKPGG